MRSFTIAITCAYSKDAELFQSVARHPRGGSRSRTAAGLWESWRDPAGEVLRSFTIATTAVNADMAQLHERMPVILEPAAWPVWLGEEAGDYAALLQPAAVGVVRLWPVSRAVNSVRNKLLIDGSNDLVFYTVNAFNLQQHFPNAQLIIYLETGHGPQDQYPDNFVRDVTAFLDEARR